MDAPPLSADLAGEPGDEYELVLTPAARRALTERLPEAVAGAAINSLTTTFMREPRRVGTPLRGELPGIWTALRGSYRVLHRLREDRREVIVVRIEHRKDAYRPL